MQISDDPGQESFRARGVFLAEFFRSLRVCKWLRHRHLTVPYRRRSAADSPKCWRTERLPFVPFVDEEIAEQRVVMQAIESRVHAQIRDPT